MPIHTAMNVLQSMMSFRIHFIDLVTMPEGPHPIPFRTRSLSLPGPMVLCLKARESRSLPSLSSSSANALNLTRIQKFKTRRAQPVGFFYFLRSDLYSAKYQRSSRYDFLHVKRLNSRRPSVPQVARWTPLSSGPVLIRKTSCAAAFNSFFRLNGV